MERKQKIIDYVCKSPEEKEMFSELIDEFIFLEKQLCELKKLPFIKTNPNNPAQQKSTAASKLYKELLQQYTNIIKILEKSTDDESDSGKSPLREWFSKNAN